MFEFIGFVKLLGLLGYTGQEPHGAERIGRSVRNALEEEGGRTDSSSLEVEDPTPSEAYL